ncbi:type 1 fimbrial protein [Metakosakonia massiliensis]|uniref:PAP fimbrial minor pilin protein n=1 Tax=Phytobacter massiliensis TaxID=1485952 RepID=A0A6N3EK90_9ENTR|nr:fimbrial protein [Phytobacter massiliensis]
MKKFIPLIAAATLTFAALPALAADGTLKFKGSIGDSSCQVMGAENSEITVHMGSVPMKTLQTNPNGPEVGFAITLQNCKKGTYYLVLDGVSAEGHPDVLMLDPDSQAKGVGIQIHDIQGNEVVLNQGLTPNEGASMTIDAPDGETTSGTFYLKARYFAYNPEILSTGTADATATFTVVQH